MSTGRLDTYIPDFAPGVAVTSGVTWVGPLLPLHGAAGVSIQVLCTNGAAGSLTIGPSNFEAVPAVIQSNGLPPLRNGSTLSVSANGSGDLSYVMSSAQTFWKSLTFTFAPTASGNLYIAINVRRFNS